MPAPKGNANALKHGLYARHYQLDEIPELRRMAWNDLLFEMMAARSKADMAHELAKKEKEMPTPDITKVVALLGAWDDALNTVGNLAARIASLTGADTELNDALSDALAGLPMFEDEEDSDQRKGLA